MPAANSFVKILRLDLRSYGCVVGWSSRYSSFTHLPTVFSFFVCLSFQADATSAECAVYDSEILPKEYVDVLPNFRPNERVARAYVGVTEARFIHQAVGQIDPNVIFSRDVMHQNRAATAVSHHQQQRNFKL